VRGSASSRPKIATVGDRVFYVAAARTWNSLTFDLTSASSLSTFRHQLRTLLFTRSYPDSFRLTWQTVFVLCYEFHLFVWRCYVSLQSSDDMPPKSVLWWCILSGGVFYFEPPCRFLEWPNNEHYYKDHCNDASQTVKKSGEGMKVENDEFLTDGVSGFHSFKIFFENFLFCSLW